MCISFTTYFSALRCHHQVWILDINLELAMYISGDRGGTVVKVLCYKSEGR